ncbi:MAG: FKBP-type peptidyl-prolyl cis-trans isomerase [Pirellulaceae bacterium]|nr:FKBP-type peptidyl-prolyl cis-trans isomerase [Pirellulaceae bacterium]
MLRLFGYLVLAGLLACNVSTLTAQETEQKQAGNTQAAEKSDERTLEQKVCFLIGFNMGEQLKGNGINVDMDQLIAGLKTALANQDLGMTPQEAQGVMLEFAQQLEAREAKKMEELALKNTQEGDDYLKGNASKEGVKTFDSGLQVRVISKGAADAEMPTAESFVRVHYTGKLVDGTVFDSTEGRAPVQFPVSGVIRGMTEGLKTMRVGDKVELVIPSNLAYGIEGRMPRIGPNALLIFEVELVEVSQRSDDE